VGLKRWQCWPWLPAQFQGNNSPALYEMHCERLPKGGNAWVRVGYSQAGWHFLCRKVSLTLLQGLRQGLFAVTVITNCSTTTITTGSNPIVKITHDIELLLGALQCLA